MLAMMPEAAGAMIDHIPADETPHVEYLRAALSELRARTLRMVDGGTIPGRRVYGLLRGILRGRAARNVR
jgi:hypothetical protein